jgi:hypothetical protein
LRLNNVERQPTPQAQKIQSQLDSHSAEHVWTTELDEIVQQISNINEEEKSRLHRILETYVDSMTVKPGKCKLFTYKFQMETDKPIVGYSRPIPFAFSPAARQQIEQMVKDDILEVSSSPILNPLTVAHREGKKIPIPIFSLTFLFQLHYLEEPFYHI